MTFFFHTPAPELMAEEPRKTGMARLWEILSRDFGRLFKAGFLALAGSLPFAVGVAFAVASHGLLPAMLFGLIGGGIAGPQLCGMADTVLRSLRDEPGFWWNTYRRAWTRSAKAALLFGGVGGLLLGTEIFLLFHGEMLSLALGTRMMLLAGALLILGFSTYIWPQLALMELPFGAVIKNAALLFVGQLPRSIAALAVQAVYWLPMLEHLDRNIPLLLITNFWVPFLAAIFLIYPGLSSGFQIEARIDALQRERHIVPAADQDAGV